MQPTPFDDADADYWTRQIRLGGLIAVGVTLLCAGHIALDWRPAYRWMAVPIMVAVVVQGVATALPWRRLVRHLRVRQWLILWWVAEIPVLLVFARFDHDGLLLYLPGAALVVVLAAALFSPGVVMALGTLSVAGFLALLPYRPDVSLVFAAGMASLIASVVGISAINAHNRRRLDSRRRSAERRTETLLENSSDGVIAVAAHGEVRYASPAMQAILGHRPDALTSKVLARSVHPDDLARIRDWMHALWSAPSGHTARTETRLQHADGTWLFVDVIGTNRVDDPDLSAAIISLRDIGARRALEEELTRLAFTDPLTGLPNRALFGERLEEAAARRCGRPVSVLLLDLDDFKLVNDNLGHSAGDKLLTTVADRLRRHVRDGDTLARLGGDEFALLVEDLGPAELGVLAERLLREVRQPVRLCSREVTCSSSIGIATTTDDHDLPAERLLRNADLAMYAAKRSGRDAHATFDPQMYATVLREAQQRIDMEEALAVQEFVVHYQPVVDLPTRQLTGVEALVRWEHPREGLLSPDRFIQNAEQSGLIVPLGRWVLRQSCQQLARWHREVPGATGLRLNVNLSARQFQYAGLVDDVAEAIADAGIAPNSLTLEITESMLMLDIDSTIRTLGALHDLGVQLAIDDFGTGYSSLSYLKQLPVDVIKIDRSFVMQVATDVDDISLVEAIVRLGKALRLQIVAEGIETGDQWAMLHRLGCDSGQGYLFGRPGDPAAVTALLRESGRVAEPTCA